MSVLFFYFVNQSTGRVMSFPFSSRSSCCSALLCSLNKRLKIAYYKNIYRCSKQTESVIYVINHSALVPHRHQSSLVVVDGLPMTTKDCLITNISQLVF